MTKYSLEERISIYAKPLEDQFVKVFQQGDAIVLKHLIRSDLSSDYIRVLDVAKALALEKRGAVYILPEINAHEKELRMSIGLSTDNGFTPDIMIEVGSFIDVKSPENIDRLSTNACKAYKQGGVACITDHSLKLDKGLIDKYAKWVLESQGYKYKEVYFYIERVLYKRAKD
jgi:hypothetical protein